jgi:ATP synthase protein I
MLPRPWSGDDRLIDGDKSGTGGSFEDRLRAARKRQGLDAPSGMEGEPAGMSHGSAMSIGMRVVVELVSALVVGVVIGVWLDKWFHTRPLFLLIFIVLGSIAGGRSAWRVVKKVSGT